MWGTHKKRLSSLHSANGLQQELVAKFDEELKKVIEEVRGAEDGIMRFEDKVKAEQRVQATLTEEMHVAERERKTADSQNEELRRRILEVQEHTEANNSRRNAMYHKLNEMATCVKTEHDTAEFSAEAAIKVAASLRFDHDAERQRWQLTRQAHDDLQKHVSSTYDLCVESKVDRDLARAQWSEMKAELVDLNADLRRLMDDLNHSKDHLAQKMRRRVQLESDFCALKEEHATAIASHETLEEQFKMRKGALITVVQDLEKRKVLVGQEIDEFERTFEDAKVEREHLTAQNDAAQEHLAKFLPEYFQLQKEHSAKRRELEMTRRRHEMTTWEIRKIHRDLEGLSRSYEPLTPLAF